MKGNEKGYSSKKKKPTHVSDQMIQPVMAKKGTSRQKVPYNLKFLCMW